MCSEDVAHTFTSAGGFEIRMNAGFHATVHAKLEQKLTSDEVATWPGWARDDGLLVVSSNSTWKTIIDAITLNVKSRLETWSRGKTQENVENILYPVPFKLKTGGEESFYYSSDCTWGCVVSETPET